MLHGLNHIISVFNLVCFANFDKERVPSDHLIRRMNQKAQSWIENVEVHETLLRFV